MAGEAKTTNFMLGAATVMLGPPASMFNFTPDTHSIGLVKNFRITAEPQYTDLTQGVRNDLVYSVLTQNTIRASMEVYEYTSKNLAYGLGLDGSALAAQTVETTTAAAVNGSGTPTGSVTVTSATGLLANDYVAIQVGSDDQVIVRRVASLASNVLTVAPLVGINVANGAAVRKLNRIKIGEKVEQPFLAAKIVGTLANGKEVILLLPKLRITRGFDMAFGSTDWGNLPFEFTIYDQVTTDAHYAEFDNGRERARLLAQD